MAKSNKNMWKTVGVVVIALILIVAVWGFSQSQFDKDKNPAEKCSIVTTLDVFTVNALSKSTDLSPAYKYESGSGIFKTFTSGAEVNPGQKITIFASLANYIDTSEEITIECGVNELTIEMYDATAGVGAIKIKNDDGTYMDLDAEGGAVNQTALAEGESLSVDYEIAGTTLQTTGNLILIVEASSTTNVTGITMSGAAVALDNVPGIYTSNVAGSKVMAFKLPAIVGSVKNTYTLSFEVPADKKLSGAVYTTYYAEQEFVDDNGTLAEGIADASGDAKYENTGSANFLINAE